jgi:hypothetical protein
MSSIGKGDKEGWGRQLVERLEAAYNQIDLHIRAETHADTVSSFSKVVGDFVKGGQLSRRDKDLLSLVADLRNLLVHRKTEPNVYVAVPSASVVEALEALRDRLTRPVRALAAFS